MNMNVIDTAGRAADFAALIGDVARRLLPEPNQALSSRHELRYGRRGSLAVDLSAGTWFDHEAGEGGGALDLACRRMRTNKAGALRWMESVGLLAPGADAAPEPKSAAEDEASRTARALALWREAVDPAGTLVERYLSRRSLTLPSDAGSVLRFHPACPFGRQERWPCMLALMRDVVTGEPVAIHRTALTADATKRDRKMMGPAGSAAVMLSENASVTYSLGIAEGIETALSILAAGWHPVWALGSAGAIARFPLLPALDELTVFADPDPAGLEAAKVCAQRWADAGRCAFVQVPDGGDFNDIVKSGF